MEAEKAIVPVLDMGIIQALAEGMQTKLEACRETATELSVTSEALAAMDYKDVKRFEQECSKAKGEAEQALRDFNRSWKEPADAIARAFKAELVTIENLHSAYKQERVSRDDAEKEQRRASLEAVYNQFIEDQEMGALFLLMPFDQIMNKSWLNKSYGAKKAENELIDLIIKAISEWNTLRAANLNYPDETVGVYFETLSLKDALEFDKSEKEKRDKLAALKAQVEENAAYDPFEPRQVEEPVKPETAAEGEPGRVWEYNLRFVCDEQTLERVRQFFRSNGIKAKISKKEVQ